MALDSALIAMSTMMRKANVGVLLDRALAAQGDGRPQPPVVDRGGAAVQPEERLAGRQRNRRPAARTR